MKRECAVVQDLLVLYEDDVLKEQSKQMIEEHIRGCEECMQVYENAGKELPAMEDVPEPSDGEKEDAAVRVMKKLAKRITYKTAWIFAAVAAVVSIAVIMVNSICDDIMGSYGWGIMGMIYTIPTEDIRVTELYQLKNGDIYCMLESDKDMNGLQLGDWIIPEGKEMKNTDKAAKEIRFCRTPFWRQDTDIHRSSVIFTLERQGIIQGGGDRITQSCSEISIYGRTRKDKLTVWKAGQRLKEAPENIEENAICIYVQQGQTAKAVRECEAIGWDDYEEIFVKQDEEWNTYTGEQGEKVEFTSGGNSIEAGPHLQDFERR